MADSVRSFYVFLAALITVVNYIRCGVIQENGSSEIGYNKYEVLGDNYDIANSNSSTVFEKIDNGHISYRAGECSGKRDLLYEDSTTIEKSPEERRNILGSIQMFFNEGVQISCLEVSGTDGLGAPRLIGGGLGADNVEFDLQHYPPGTYTLHIMVYQKPMIVGE